MLSFQIGNITVNLSPTVIFIFVVLPLVVLFTGIIKTKQINSMKTLCQSGDYEKSILLANKLITYYTRSYKLYRVKRTKKEFEAFHIWLAISYLGLSKYDMFWESINKVDQYPNLKYAWIGTYYVIKKDVEQVKIYKDKIEPSEEMKNTLALFTGVVMCEEGNVSKGKEILSEILPKLNFELTKKIVLNYTT
ncbi:MAG: hypothetical protein IJX62_01495 [Clostridia bacterium]|nr:hypothetical protein [Clostridia bacterium]